MTAPLPRDFEKLGVLYLGRVLDAERGTPGEELLLYDSRDLVTHAVCVGMTGSGKTGLGIALLEEAALDGVPALVIDPKGDLGNLLLNFPDLAPQDFAPWIDAGQAAREGKSAAELAEATAAAWRAGLAEWGEDGERVRRLAASAELALYTPGSGAGRQLTVLRSFAPPPPELAADREAAAERIQAAVTGLLALVGVGGDPLQSREAILLANLLQQAFDQGRAMSLQDLIRGIQTPPFESLGVFDLETFFPAKERLALALSLNAVLASPGFAPWLAGEPLDIDRLLHTKAGKPRIAVLSIAHLSEAERMFFVTLLLNEVVAWTRRQSGTSSLRALLYMDEIYGFFPPVGEPPSKRPMLTLLKQARASGLGVVLATQNPVDLDYKGLANAGTWFLGRLQTERDKQRVLDGLEGALSSTGGFDRGRLGTLISGLGKRVFLMHNVHEDGPVLFQTRWTLSYLRGPLTLAEIRRLSAGAAVPAPAQASTAAPAAAPVDGRPLAPSGVPERFLAGSSPAPAYRPTFACTAKLHYASAPRGLDLWRTLFVVAPLSGAGGEPDWAAADIAVGEAAPELCAEPGPGASFAPLPAAAQRTQSWAGWAKRLAAHLYETAELELWRSAEWKLVSAPGESEGAFRARVALAAREQRDGATADLRARYAPKVAAARERIRRAEERIGREEEQYDQRKRESWISAGSAVLGSLFGRKLASSASVSRAGSAMRSAGRASKEKADIERAERERAAELSKLAVLERELEAEVAGLAEPVRPELLPLERVAVAPRKGDLSAGEPFLLWIPATAPVA